MMLGAIAKMTDQNRESWHNTWMNIAAEVARRSYDPRLQVGAIVVPSDNTQILSLGYNGNAHGLPNEPESLQPGQSAFVHAEINALIKLNVDHHKRKLMYVTHFPCPMCSKFIIQGRISEVIFEEIYRDMSGLEHMLDAGISVHRYSRELDSLITISQDRSVEVLEASSYSELMHEYEIC